MTVGMRSPCEVCNLNQPMAVVSSALGAVSFSICSECLGKHAEPEYCFEVVAWTSGDLVRDDVREMTTFKNGAYITYPEWFKLYGEAASVRLDKSYNEQMEEAAERQENEGGMDDEPRL